MISFVTMVLSFVTKVLGGLYIADFLSGVFHWWEDRYGNPNWPVIGHTIRMNQEHHIHPRFFLTGNLWTRNREILALGVIFLAVFWLVGWLNVVTLSIILFGLCANEIHASAHSSPKENGRLISFIQWTGFMQSHKHHAFHHRRAKNTHYCVMTNHVNPFLEFIGFFRVLEWVIRKVSGITPRHDPSVNPRYL